MEITKSFTKHLQDAISQHLSLRSSFHTECEDYCLTIYNLIYDNQDMHRFDAPYTITPESDDYQDLIYAIEDYIKDQNWDSPSYHVNCITCNDTANPYNIIDITLSFEHNY